MLYIERLPPMSLDFVYAKRDLLKLKGVCWANYLISPNIFHGEKMAHLIHRLSCASNCLQPLSSMQTQKSLFPCVKETTVSNTQNNNGNKGEGNLF